MNVFVILHRLLIMRMMLRFGMLDLVIEDKVE